MTTETASPGPPPRRQRELYRVLREQIIRGDLAVGERIPTRRVLQRKFDAAPQTVDRAVHRLIDGGFCEARGRHGTFVVDHPPHLCRYGMLFPINAPGESHSSFYTGLQRVAEDISREDRRFQISGYYGIHANPRSDDYERLSADLRHQRLAGIITCVPPHVWPADGILQDPGVPQVGIMADNQRAYFPKVGPGLEAFLTMSLDHLRDRGCRRAGIIQIDTQSAHEYDAFAEACAERDLTTQPVWCQPTTWQQTDQAAKVAQLLMFSRDPAPPDGIVIADDHLVPGVTEGLRRAGVGEGRTVHVAAHCNEPFRPESRVPVAWVGFDLRQMMRRCFKAIDQQRQGLATEEMTWIAPQLDASQAR